MHEDERFEKGLAVRKAVLGNAQVQELARQLGLPVDQALKTMAQYLPEIVDKASPNGVLKS